MSNVLEAGQVCLRQLHNKNAKETNQILNSMQRYVNESLSNISNSAYTAKDVAIGLQVFGKMSCNIPDFYDLMIARIEHLQNDFRTPRDVCFCFWGFAKLKRSRIQLDRVNSAIPVLLSRLQDDEVISAFKWAPQDVSMILWSFGVLNINNKSVIQAITTRSLQQDLRDRWSPTAAANALWGLATCGISDPEKIPTLQQFMSSVVTQSTNYHKGSFYPRDLAVILWSVSRLKSEDFELAKNLVSVVRKIKLSQQQATMVLRSTIILLKRFPEIPDVRIFVHDLSNLIVSQMDALDSKSAESVIHAALLLKQTPSISIEIEKMLRLPLYNVLQRIRNDRHYLKTFSPEVVRQVSKYLARLFNSGNCKYYKSQLTNIPEKEFLDTSIHHRRVENETINSSDSDITELLSLVSKYESNKSRSNTSELQAYLTGREADYNNQLRRRDRNKVQKEFEPFKTITSQPQRYEFKFPHPHRMTVDKVPELIDDLIFAVMHLLSNMCSAIGWAEAASPQLLSDVLWSFTTTTVVVPSLITQVWHRFETTKSLKILDTRRKSQLLWCAAQHLYLPESVGNEIMSSWKDSELLPGILWTFGKISIPLNNNWVGKHVGTLLHSVPSYNPTDLNTSLWGLSRLGPSILRVPDTLTLFQEVASVIDSDKFTDVELVDHCRKSLANSYKMMNLKIPSRLAGIDVKTGEEVES